MSGYSIGGTDDWTTDRTSMTSDGKSSPRILNIWMSFMNAPRNSRERSTTRNAFLRCRSSRARSPASADRNGCVRASHA